MFFYTQADRLAEEKVETPDLALGKVNARDFSKTLAAVVEGVKVKTLANIMANIEAETLVDLLANTVA